MDRSLVLINYDWRWSVLTKKKSRKKNRHKGKHSRLIILLCIAFVHSPDYTPWIREAQRQSTCSRQFFSFFLLFLILLSFFLVFFLLLLSRTIKEEEEEEERKKERKNEIWNKYDCLRKGQKNAIYWNKTQQVNFLGNLFYPATKQHINYSRLNEM